MAISGSPVTGLMRELYKVTSNPTKLNLEFEKKSVCKEAARLTPSYSEANRQHFH